MLNCLTDWSINPINQKELEQEDFYSTNLEECFIHYKETGNCEPIENAIFENEAKLERANKAIVEAITLLRNNGLEDTANFLCKLRNDLKK
jgi:hypothetical protein